MKIISHSLCLLLVLCLLTVVLSSPLAGAEIKSLRVPGEAFRPVSSSVGFSMNQGGMYATSNPSISWTAPVYLPQGAVVTSVRMFYIDNNAASCACSFIVIDFLTQTAISNGTSSSGSSSSVAYVDFNVNHTIDYSKYAYALNWTPGVADSTMKLIGFEIFYTPPPGRAAVIPLF